MKTNSTIIIERFCSVPEIPLSPTNWIELQAKDIDGAMKEARIDTLLHLKDQMEVNAKKLNGESCMKLVEDLINQIRKA